jgi:hypothetical protein
MEPVLSRWNELIADPDLDRIRPLLAAAFEDRNLSRVYPEVSHLTQLRLIKNIVDRSVGQVCITVAVDGRYRVEWTGDRPTENSFDSISEAVSSASAMIARQLSDTSCKTER